MAWVCQVRCDAWVARVLVGPAPCFLSQGGFQSPRFLDKKRGMFHYSGENASLHLPISWFEEKYITITEKMWFDNSRINRLLWFEFIGGFS